MKLKKILLFFFILLLLASAFFLWRIAPLANGYAAKYVCSHTYTSQLDPEKGMELYIKPMHPLFRGVKYELDTIKKEVTTRYLGIFRPRTAVWREGCGCTLLVDGTTEELHSRHDVPHAITTQDTSHALWPEGNIVSRDSIPHSIHWYAIDKILDDAMQETTDDTKFQDNTLALVVAWKGRIIGERYADGVYNDTPLASWSATKSVTSALTGVMVKDHGLDIHAKVDLPQWANDARKNITIDHLLRMETGLDFEENYAPMADATEMLYGCPDMGVFAAGHPPAAEPDLRWSYSSGTSNLLADLLYSEVGSTPAAMHHLAYDEFFNRLGITTAVFEHDESDAFVGSSYLYMSARDWLRVCKLYMNDGVWNGERILPEGWVKYSLTPTPHATNACYGAHIWLNAAPNAADRYVPGLPPDTFIFKGFQGQWIVGIPSKDIMVARLGVSNEEKGWSPEEVIVKILEILNGH